MRNTARSRTIPPSGRGHHVDTNSKPLLEDDDRLEILTVGIQPYVIHPHRPSSSAGRHGVDHCTLPIVAYIVGNPLISSSGDTPQMESPVAPNREVQLEAEVPQRRTAKVHTNSPAAVPARSRSHSHDPAQASPDLDTLSSDSADSLREQVRQVHQRLDEV
ncbi:hypothetical protein BHM03_00007000 [Ensete ventricosum]|nr:hypothetical protein BHM03_00007000 [Ensete ventricosum]